MYTAYDVLGADEYGTNIEPFYKAQEKDETLKWLNKVFDILIQDGEQRTRVQRENLLHYRGISLQKNVRDRDRDESGRRLNKLQRFLVNHLYDLTETKVAQMTRLKPAVEVLPTNEKRGNYPHD